MQISTIYFEHSLAAIPPDPHSPFCIAPTLDQSRHLHSEIAGFTCGFRIQFRLDTITVIFECTLSIRSAQRISYTQAYSTKYLVHVMSKNDGIQSTIELTQQVDHLRRLTLCRQFCESNNLRKVHGCLCKDFRHRFVRSYESFRNIPENTFQSAINIDQFDLITD